MSSIALCDLEHATKILQVRLSGRLAMGVNIISPYTAEMPSNLNEHPGRFVGFFFIRDTGDPSFVWLCRNYAEFPGFNHVAVYYVNVDFKSIPDGDRDRFASKKLAPHTTYSISIFRTNAPKFLDLSALVHGLEVTLQAGKLSLRPCGLYGLPSAHLQGERPPKIKDLCNPNDLRDNELWAKIQALNFKWEQISTVDEPPRIEPDFDVIRIHLHELRGIHVAYGIHYKSIKSLMLILVHHYTLWDRKHVADVKGFLSRCVQPYEFSHIGATRYYHDKRNDSDCFHSDVLRACLLALRHPIDIIKSTDLDHFIDEEYFSRMSRVEDPASQFSSTQESTQIVNPDYEPGTFPESFIRYSQLGEGEVLNGWEADMSIVDPGVSTQGTVIEPTCDVEEEIDRLWTSTRPIENLDVMRAPPLIESPPHDDREGNYLQTNALFMAYVKSIAVLGEKFATIKVLAPIPLYTVSGSCIDLFLEDVEFIFQPVVLNTTVLIYVVDTVSEEWGYFDPSLGTDQEYQTMIDHVKADGKIVSNWTGWPIRMTSQYHREYPNLHVLMAMFGMIKLLKLAKRIPRRVFYPETNFRLFSWNLCHWLQLVNARHNLKEGLYGSNGYLRATAFKTASHAASYTPAAVSTVECPFCNVRGPQLVQHIRMAHGGQARMAREARRRKEQQSG